MGPVVRGQAKNVSFFSTLALTLLNQPLLLALLEEECQYCADMLREEIPKTGNSNPTDSQRLSVFVEAAGACWRYIVKLAGGDDPPAQ